MHYLKNILMISTVFLTSCTYIYGDQGVIPDRDTDYLKAKSVPPLKIPPGFSSDTIQAYYPIPERTTENLQKPNLIPPEL
jgi:uncharacterized lipoprotein